MNSAEPLSSRNNSEAVTGDRESEQNVDENYNKASDTGEDPWPLPTTPRHNTSLNASILTSPEGEKSPEPVLDIEIERLRQFVPSLLSAFKVTQKIGEGTFSTVFKAHPIEPELSHLTVALKHIIPASLPQRTENEVKCLKDIDGKDNVCPVLSCIRENDHIVLVMPHIPHDRFQDYFLDMDIHDIKEYLWNLMLSLRKVHSFNIIHRDVKPANFLFNKSKRTYCLVDFGLAHPIETPPSPARKKKAMTELANLRKSPRKIKKPDSYSETKRPSPMKQKLDTDNRFRVSPRNCQSLDQVDKKSPGKRKSTAFSTSYSKNGEKLFKKTLFSPEKKIENVHIPPPVEDILNPNKGRTFKSPRRVLLQKRLADQSETIVQPVAKPRSFCLQQMASPGAQLKSPRTTLTSPAASKVRLPFSSSTPLRASHMPMKSTLRPKCNCMGENTVCSICTYRPAQNAQRAGTPGFRCPEVLLKSSIQGTAVDVWSAGVIFLSILSGRYPFFKATSDMIALSQIIAIFGFEKLEQTANRLGKKLVCSENAPAVDLQTMCEKLKTSALIAKFGHKRVETRGEEPLPVAAYNLLAQLLEIDPTNRITAADALYHPFLKDLSEQRLGDL